MVVYLEGGISETRHATDHEPMFRQESYFHYLFGVREPDVCGCVELDTGRATLFIPKLPEEYATIMGRIKSREEVREEYGVDDVRYVEDVEAYLLEVVGRGDGASVAADSDSGTAGGRLFATRAKTTRARTTCSSFCTADTPVSTRAAMATRASRSVRSRSTRRG